MNPSEFYLKPLASGSALPANTRSSRSNTNLSTPATPVVADGEDEDDDDDDADAEEEAEAEDAVMDGVDDQQQEEEEQQQEADSGPALNRKEQEMEKKELELGELLEMMEDWKPIIPDEVTDYYLQRSGFETSDVRVKRLLALAAQRFVSSISSDAYQYARTRTIAGPIGSRNKDGTIIGGGAAVSSSAKAKERARTVLTTEDLAAALAEYGIGGGRAAYYL